MQVGRECGDGPLSQVEPMPPPHQWSGPAGLSPQDLVYCRERMCSLRALYSLGSPGAPCLTTWRFCLQTVGRVLNAQQDPLKWEHLPVTAAFSQAFLWGCGLVQIQILGFYLGTVRCQL